MDSNPTNLGTTTTTIGTAHIDTNSGLVGTVTYAETVSTATFDSSSGTMPVLPDISSMIEGLENLIGIVDMGPNTEDVFNTMDKIDQLFDRAGIPYIYIGQTAYALFYGYEPETIEIAVKINDWTDYAKSVWDEVARILDIKTVLPKQFRTSPTQTIHLIDSNNVPVEIRVVKRDVKFLANPDKVVYRHMFCRIPNPFADYWKARLHIY